MEEEEEDGLMPEENPEDGVEDCRTPDRLDSTDGVLIWLFSGVIRPLDHIKLGPCEIRFISSPDSVLFFYDKIKILVIKQTYF